MYQMPLKLEYLLFSEHASGFLPSCCFAHVGTKWIRISFNHPCQNPTNSSRVSSAIFGLMEAFLNCLWPLLSLPPEVAFCIAKEFCSICKASLIVSHNYENVIICKDTLFLLSDYKFLVQKHFFSHCSFKASNILLCTEDNKILVHLPNDTDKALTLSKEEIPLH